MPPGLPTSSTSKKKARSDLTDQAVKLPKGATEAKRRAGLAQCPTASIRTLDPDGPLLGYWTQTPILSANGSLNALGLPHQSHLDVWNKNTVYLSWVHI